MTGQAQTQKEIEDEEDRQYRVAMSLIQAIETEKDLPIAKVVQFVEAGAALDDSDIYGKTALMAAGEELRPDIVEYLLRKGADPKFYSEHHDSALGTAEAAAAQYVRGIEHLGVHSAESRKLHERLERVRMIVRILEPLIPKVERKASPPLSDEMRKKYEAMGKAMDEAITKGPPLSQSQKTTY